MAASRYMPVQDHPERGGSPCRMSGARHSTGSGSVGRTWISFYGALSKRLVIDWLKEASTSAVAKQCGLSWDEVDGVMQRAVERGLARREKQRPEREARIKAAWYRRDLFSEAPRVRDRDERYYQWSCSRRTRGPYAKDDGNGTH